MAIPITAIATKASESSLVNPLIEFATNEIKRLKILSLGDENSSGRADPTHVGVGFDFALESERPEEEACLTSDTNVRFDFLTFNIDKNSIDPPTGEQRTPAVHVSNKLKAYDSDGEQSWLLGYALQEDRLRSMETKIHWNHDGWNADIILEDACYNGFDNPSHEIPGRMSLFNDGGQDVGFGECVAKMFRQRQSHLADVESPANHYMRTLEGFDLAQNLPSGFKLQPGGTGSFSEGDTITNGNGGSAEVTYWDPDIPLQITNLSGEFANGDTISGPNGSWIFEDYVYEWSFQTTALDTFVNNPDPYLSEFLMDDGEWDLTQPLFSGNSILEHYSELYPNAKMFKQTDGVILTSWTGDGFTKGELITGQTSNTTAEVVEWIPGDNRLKLTNYSGDFDSNESMIGGNGATGDISEIVMGEYDHSLHLELLIPARQYNVDLFLLPEGRIDFLAIDWPICLARNVSIHASLDFVGEEPEQSNDGMILTIDAHIDVSKKNRGLLKNSYIELTYDDTKDIEKRFDVDWVFPFFKDLIGKFKNTSSQSAYHSINAPIPTKLLLTPKSGTIDPNSSNNDPGEPILKSMTRSGTENNSLSGKRMSKPVADDSQNAYVNSTTPSTIEGTSADTGFLTEIDMPAGVFGEMNCKEFITNVLPLLSIDIFAQIAIERLLLRSFSAKNIIGETLEALDLVEQQADGSYRCQSFIELIIDPRKHIEDMMYDYDSLHDRRVANVGTLLRLGSVVRDQMLSHTNIPLPQDPLGKLTIPLGWHGAAFANIEITETVAPGGVTIALTNPVKTINGVTSSALGLGRDGSELEFNVQASFLPTAAGYGFSMSGASISLDIDLFETAETFLLVKKFNNFNAASAYQNPFIQGSNIKLTASIGGAQTILPLDHANLPVESVDDLINTIFDDDTANLTLEINLDGTNTHSLKLMPDLDRNAVKNFFSQILNSAITMMLPHLLTIIVHRLKLILIPSDSTTLGDELISLLTDIGLWDQSVNLGSNPSQQSTNSPPPGAIDLVEFNRLVDDSNTWLLGSEGDTNNPPVQGKLPELFSSGFKTMSRFLLPDSTDDFTIITMQGKPLTRILWHPDPDPEVPPYAIFDIGENEWEAGSTDIGMWLKLSIPNINLSDNIDLLVDGSFSLKMESLDTVNIEPMMLLDIRTSSPIVNRNDVKINPAVRVNWNETNSKIEVATNHSIRYTFTGGMNSHNGRIIVITNAESESHELITNTNLTIVNSTSTAIGLNDADTPEKRLQALHKSLQLAMTEGKINLDFTPFNPGVSTELNLVQSQQGTSHNNYIKGEFADEDPVFGIKQHIDEITFLDPVVNETSGYGFWAEIKPQYFDESNNARVPTEIQYGAESKPGESIANTLLALLLEIRSTREFLTSPIVYPKPEGELDISWDHFIKTVTNPAIILNTLRVGEVQYDAISESFDFSTFNFRSVEDIKDIWEGVSPIKTIIGCLISVVESGFQGTIGQSVPIYNHNMGNSTEDNDCNKMFQIRLVDGNEASGELKLGLQFIFNDIKVKIGKLMLNFYTEGEPKEWTEVTNMQGGINLYFATWDSANWALNPDPTALPSSMISEHLSLEVGGLGIKLEHSEDKPLIDKKIQLNTVSTVLAVDYQIVDRHQQNVPFCSMGVKIELDNFGLLLKGGDDSDGGNSLAQSLLKGEKEEDCAKLFLDLAIWKYGSNPVDFALEQDGVFWIQVQKKMGPLYIQKFGLYYWEDPAPITCNCGGTPKDQRNTICRLCDYPLINHRLKILVDGHVEKDDEFKLTFDDFEIDMPIINFWVLNEWTFDLKGLYLEYDDDKVKISGGLLKSIDYSYFDGQPPSSGSLPSRLDDKLIVRPNNNGNGGDLTNADLLTPPIWPDDMTWALKYLEYMGTCTVKVDDLTITAVGGIARIPSLTDGSGFVSMFLIAAVGQRPYLFNPVKSMMLGFGINREMELPVLSKFNDHPFIKTLNDAAGSLLANISEGELPSEIGDPQTMLNDLKPKFPVKYGRHWLAIGGKFDLPSAFIIDADVVIYSTFGGGSFNIGMIGIVDIVYGPTPPLLIGAGFQAVFDSEENSLLIQVMLQDYSWIGLPIFKVQGGIAYKQWFDTGEFVISVGGYHPNFPVPTNYPQVPRLSIYWDLGELVHIGGNCYFTICSSALMFGASASAVYSGEKLYVEFGLYFDGLIYFDPFWFEFELGVSIYLSWKEKYDFELFAGIGVRGPKIHGEVTAKALGKTWVIPFGDPTPKTSQIDFKTFINRYVRQLPQDQYSQDIGSWFGNDGWFDAKISCGEVKLVEADSSPYGDEGEPWLLTPEFELKMETMFPSSQIVAEGFTWINDVNDVKNKGIHPSNPEGGKIGIDGNDISLNSVSGSLIDSAVSIEICEIKDGNELQLDSNLPGELNFIRTVKSYPTSLWSDEDPKTYPKAMQTYLSGVKIEAKADSEDPGPQISFESLVEGCKNPFNIPFQLPSSNLGPNTKPVKQTYEDLSKIMEIVSDKNVEKVCENFRSEIEKSGITGEGES
ncbi:MAG: hypothetical protein OR994_01415 [Candidatus Poseidoniales archaeon]|nr:hypothetical protein [Candidatus Poseidoniales archaeon]